MQNQIKWWASGSIKTCVDLSKHDHHITKPNQIKSNQTIYEKYTTLHQQFYQSTSRHK